MDERFLVCDEKDWGDMTENQRNWMVYKTLRLMNYRMRVLERWNKFYSFIGGVIGGVIAALGINIIK
jgi:hypothetical protein